MALPGERGSSDALPVGVRLTGRIFRGQAPGGGRPPRQASFTSRTRELRASRASMKSIMEPSM